jgi:NTP pyrophosphatase (non-canonical NTP hydrolase)
MNLKNEFQPIRDWAEDKGIYSKGDSKTQYVKLMEEMGELAESILKQNEEEFVDAIGDCVVVLTNLAKLKGYNIENCINSAYAVIAKRKGKMENGTFKKDE